METVLLYFGKVILCSGVMFLYYKLSLKDKTFHHYNRFYLLFAMLISLLLPLIKIEDFTIEVSNDIYKLIDTVQNFNHKNPTHDYPYFRIIFSALGLVSCYFLGRFIYGIIKIQQLKKQFQRESFDGINFYRTNLTEAPFSYFKNLFWKNSITLNSDIGKQILKHEMVHIEQKHSFDKIFIEIITSVFWFNPFFHIIKKEISLIHEYLADKKAVKKSDTKAFAQMLLASHFSGNPLPATSPFLSSNLKKRLKMLQKPKTKFGYARRIFALPVVFSVAFAYLVNAKNQEIKATNMEIEKAVSQIKKENKPILKKDTITPKSPKENEVLSPKDLKENQKRISALNKDIAEKSKGLEKLKPESEEFQVKVKEIAALASEAVKISDAEMMQKLGSDFKINNKVKTNVDWEIVTEGEPTIREMSDFKFDFPDTPPTPPNAPNVKLYTFKGTGDINWSPEMEKSLKMYGPNTKESVATAKKRAKLEKERARLEAKRAKLEGERAKLEAERRALDGNRRAFIYSSTFNNSPEINALTLRTDGVKIRSNGKSIIASGIKNASGEEDMTVYIDGKLSTKKDMQALDPAKIKSMNISKKRLTGENTSGEIRIETRR